MKAFFEADNVYKVAGQNQYPSFPWRIGLATQANSTC
jgi:hypothetical protein